MNTLLAVLGMILWAVGFLVVLQIEPGEGRELKALGGRLFWSTAIFLLAFILLMIRVSGQETLFGGRLIASLVGMCASVSGVMWLVSIVLGRIRPSGSSFK